jgi:hypothetical protein
MNKHLFWVFILLLSQFLTAAARADDFSMRVSGLWLEIHDFPRDAVDMGFEQNDKGVTSYSRIIDDGNLALVIERLDKTITDGTAFTSDKVSDFVALAEDIDPKSVTVTENDPKMAALYSYPVAAAQYKTGINEDIRDNYDLYMFTSDWVFRIKFSISQDAAASYGDMNKGKIKDWLNSIKLRD